MQNDQAQSMTVSDTGYLVFLVGQQAYGWEGVQRDGPGPVVDGAAAADQLEEQPLLDHAAVGHGSLQGHPQLLVEDAGPHGAAARQVGRHVGLALQEALNVLQAGAAWLVEPLQGSLDQLVPVESWFLP